MKDLPTSAEAFQQEEYCVGTRQEKLIRLSLFGQIVIGDDLNGVESLRIGAVAR